VSVSAFLKGATVYEVEYCACFNLEIPIFLKDKPFAAGKFELLTNPYQTGISYLPSGMFSDGP